MDKVGSEDGFAAWGDVDDLNVLFPLETLSEMQIWGWAEFKTSCKKMSFPSTTFDSRKVLRAMEFASWLREKVTSLDFVGCNLIYQFIDQFHTVCDAIWSFERLLDIS